MPSSPATRWSLAEVGESLRSGIQPRAGGGVALGDSRVRQFALVVGICAVTGLLIPHHGTLPTLLMVGVVVIVALPLLIPLTNRAWLVPSWLVLGVIAYPFLRYPHRTGTVLTFDRVWVLFGLAVLIGRGVAQARTPASRLMLRSLLFLLVVFGLHAVFNQAQSTSALGVWIDAIVVPFGLFLMAREMAGDQRLLMRTLVAMMLAGVVVAGIGIAEHFIGFEMATLSGGATPI